MAPFIDLSPSCGIGAMIRRPQIIHPFRRLSLRKSRNLQPIVRLSLNAIRVTECASVRGGDDEARFLAVEGKTGMTPYASLCSGFDRRRRPSRATPSSRLCRIAIS
jgi:hypothetical protein